MSLLQWQRQRKGLPLLVVEAQNKENEMWRVSITLKMLRARWRVWWGFCPACNSDAPALYECPVCRYYSGHYPPTRFRRRRWLRRYESRLHCPPGYLEFIGEMKGLLKGGRDA